MERAFLGAAAAGVFVANAAGNDGPKPGTIGSPTGVPWVTSVAATTLGRTFESTFSVAPGPCSGGTPAGPCDAVAGRGASPHRAPWLHAPLVDAATVAAPGVRRRPARRCACRARSTRGAVAGKAVLCQRGQNARVEKGKVVLDAGGVGMVLANMKPDEDVVADLHWVPAVHVSAGRRRRPSGRCSAGGWRPATAVAGRWPPRRRPR